MKKNAGLLLFALCPLIPATSRVAYAIPLAVCLLIYFFSGLICKAIISQRPQGNATQALELICLGGTASVLSTILSALYPVLSISLNLYVYASAFSFIVLVSIDSFSLESASKTAILLFIPLMLIFSLAREFFGYGSVSIPISTGIREFQLISTGMPIPLRFWGTGAGALILAGIASWIIRLSQKKNQGRATP